MYQPSHKRHALFLEAAYKKATTKNIHITRKHSSRMRTARLSTVSRSIVSRCIEGGGVSTRPLERTWDQRYPLPHPSPEQKN